MRKPSSSLVPRRGLCLALLGLVFSSFWLVVSEASAQASGGTRAVATQHPLATQEALAILKRGGTAADAAITAALVSGVVNGTSSGIGGGGFVTYWDNNKKSATILDFREVAPKAVEGQAFEQRPFSREHWGKYAGVPGEVAGLYELHRRQGKLPWAELVAPAIRAAAEGFRVEQHLSNMANWVGSTLKPTDGLRRLFFPGKATQLRVGARVKNPALAETLRWIAKLGPAGFYTGPVAQDIVNTARAAGGALTLADLAQYRVLERQPLHVRWAGHDVYTMPPPSAGGLMLVQALKLFSKEELSQLDPAGPEFTHLVNEAFRGALADRMRYVGDPGFARVDTAALLADVRMKQRRGRIDPKAVRALPEYEQLEHGTHHLVTADAEGNLVSLTTTVNRAFGSKLMTRSGFVLNDELDDFTKKAWVAGFGMKQSPNRPRPGARPVSSMTPTVVVKDGQPVLAIGGSGGMRIATSVAQSVLVQLTFGTNAKELAARPRFSTPAFGGTVEIDAARMKTLGKQLEARGHTVKEGKDGSAVQLITVHGPKKEAAADPRRYGLGLVE